MRDPVDVVGARDECANERTAKSCGFDASTLAFNLVTMLAHRTGDGDKKSRSPERARRKPLKPFAQEKPECFGGPVVTNSCAFLLCTRGCGCAKHPAFPAPSVFEGHASCATRANLAAGMRTCALENCAAAMAPRNDDGLFDILEVHRLGEIATLGDCSGCANNAFRSRRIEKSPWRPHVGFATE
jgi:hypothetical protein